MAGRMPRSQGQNQQETAGIASQVAIIAQTLKQLGFNPAQTQGHKLGPKPMQAKDLVASDTKLFGGVWLEFANW